MSKFLDLTGVNNLWGKVKSKILSDITSNVTSKIGVANGIASLDANTKLPVSQLPALKTINNNSIVGEGNISIDLSLYKIVNSLPTTGIDVNKIYLVLSEAESSSNGNIYTEYIYANNKWEEIGKYKAKVDLTNYVTFADVVKDGRNGVMPTEYYHFLKNFVQGGINFTAVLDAGVYGNINPFVQNLDNVALKYHTVSGSGGLRSGLSGKITSATATQAGVMTPTHVNALESLIEDQRDYYSVRLKLDSIHQNNIIEAAISENLGRFAIQQHRNGGRYKAIAIDTYIEADDATIEIMPIVSPVRISVGNLDGRVKLSYDINFIYYQTSIDGQTASEATATIKILFNSDGSVVDKKIVGMTHIPTLTTVQHDILKNLEENAYSLIADEVLSYNADVVTIPVVVPGQGDDIQSVPIEAATSTTAGIMTAADKVKLDSLSSGGGNKFIIDYDNAEQIRMKLESLTISEDLVNNEFANCVLRGYDDRNMLSLLPASCIYTDLSLSDAANIVFTAHTDTQIITLRIDASINNNRFTVSSINLETRDIVYTNEQTTSLLKQ